MNNHYLLIILGTIGLLEIGLFKILIPYFRRLKVGQLIRELGPSNHHIKKGTPTMGGIIIIVSWLIAINLIAVFTDYIIVDYRFWLIQLSVGGYAIIGLIDDYLIVVKKSNIGFKTQPKFIVQLIIGAIIFYSLINFNHDSYLYLGSIKINLGFGYGIFLLLILVGGSNAVNLTDGVDGLASGLMMISLGGFIFLGIINHQMSLVMISLVMVIMIGIFLLFNSHPALIFMGNTGSMALGACLVTLAILYKYELLLIFIGFIFIVETISVMLQVSYFKITKGKRIFKMAPIHHHFELSGYSEIKINLLFDLIQFAMVSLGCMIGGLLF